MGKIDVIIGIDPDVEKNGCAILDCHTKQVEVSALAFADLLDVLLYEKRLCQNKGQKIEVVIEAGWLNKAHWHLSYSDTKQIAAAKGNAAGRNHEVGRKIAEMCQHWQIPYELVKPLRKCWGGKDKKITHEELAFFINLNKKRTNQEERDAALLAWVWGGFSVKICCKRL